MENYTVKKIGIPNISQNPDKYPAKNAGYEQVRYLVLTVTVHVPYPNNEPNANLLELGAHYPT